MHDFPFIEIECLKKSYSSSYRFANDELEALFERYLLKVQHGSLAATVGIFLVLTAILSGLSFGILATPTVDNMYHAVHCLIFVIILILLITKALEDTHLNYVCYVVLFFSAAFVVVGLPVIYGLSEPLGSHTGGGVEVDGMWQALFVTFLVYAMMPLKTWIALAFSTIIAATHMSVTALLTSNEKIGHHWQQVSVYRLKNFSEAYSYKNVGLT